MTDSFKTDSLRRVLIAGVAALTLAACGGGDKPSTTAGGTITGSNAEYLVPNDHVTGSPDAPVTLVEYASVACGACAGWQWCCTHGLHESGAPRPQSHCVRPPSHDERIVMTHAL